MKQSFLRGAVTLLVLAASGRVSVMRAQKEPVIQPLAVAGLAGRAVVVLPLTYLQGDARIPAGAIPTAKQAALRWADSIMGDALTERAPEVQWVLPKEVRRAARKAPGLVADPDQMGQAVMRARFRVVPDPLRAYLRNLVAVAGGGRHVFIPSAVTLAVDSSGVIHSVISAVVVDARTGDVLWRSEAFGYGRTASEALEAAMASIIPAPILRE